MIPQKLKTGLIILGIPLSVSLSWILGGELVKKMSPFVLSSSRMLIGSAILLFFSDVLKSQNSWSRSQRFTWWRNQFILAITGRVIYYYLSSSALLSISAVDAVLVTSLMPVFSLFVERIFGARFRTYLLPVCGIAASATAFSAVLSSRAASGSFSLSIGHFEIVAAIMFFTLHLSLYSRMTKDPSPVNPLMVQFTMAALFLFPADVDGYHAFASFTNANWLQFAVYSIVCNLLPFVLVHYALKLTSPLAVTSASIASPLFGIAFARLISGTEIVPLFIGMTLCSLALTWATIRLNMKEKSNVS